jgi:hypothetical protein
MLKPQKPYFPQPKAKRLPEAKRMTIALGIRAGNSIVMAADTEESSGYLKGESTKILTVLDRVPLEDASAKGSRPHHGACLISGAGTSDYVEALQEQLANVFLDNPTLCGRDLEKKFGECMEDFYRDHVIPFAAYPDDSQPQVKMLIAAQRNLVPSLFFTNRSVIVQATLHKAIGIGQMFAHNILRRLWEPASTGEIQVLAAYVAFLVKESVEGCGKLTTIGTLHGPDLVLEGESNAARLVVPSPPISYMSPEAIEILERQFRREWEPDEHESIWAKIKQSASET